MMIKTKLKQLFLLDDLPKTETGKKWKLAIGLTFCFGLRAVELNYMKPKEDQLHISYKKTVTNTIIIMQTCSAQNMCRSD